MDKKIVNAVKNIRKINDEYGTLGLEMFKANGGNMYLMDFYVTAALNRAEHLVSAFCDLIEKNNFLVAAPVLRMQLDNLFRLRAAWLVSDVNDFITNVLSGVAIGKLKDKSGNRMTDRYLVNSLCVERPELKNIYEKACAYVHLSDRHLFSIIKKLEPDGKIEISAGAISDNVSVDSYVEASQSFFRISGIILSYVKGWIITKNGGAKKS